MVVTAYRGVLPLNFNPDTCGIGTYPFCEDTDYRCGNLSHLGDTHLPWAFSASRAIFPQSSVSIIVGDIVCSDGTAAYCGDGSTDAVGGGDFVRGV